MRENEETVEITCLEVRRELVSYMEDDITPELRGRVERHLMECDGCQVIYDSVKKVVRLVSDTEIIELPEGFSRRLYARLAAL